jgi:putative nucleotidyltransferase with HDIG domain
MQLWQENLHAVEGLAAGQPVELTAEWVTGRDGAGEWKFVRAIPLPMNHAVAREAQPQSPVAVNVLVERTRALKAVLSPEARELFDIILNTPIAWIDGTLAPMRARYLIAPAATSMHHAALRGLHHHHVQVAECALAAARALKETDAPTLDLDAVILGALYHDIGKLDELGWTGVFSYTARGAAASHMGWGMCRITEIVTRAQLSGWEPTVRQRELIEHTLHIISSHHGQKDFGALVEPASREAWAVSTADMLSSRVQPISETAGTGTSLGDGWERVGTGWKSRAQFVSPHVPSDIGAYVTPDTPLLRLMIASRPEGAEDAR